MSAAFSGVEPLADHHRLVEFDCGSLAQTVWLHKHAFQAHRSGTSRVYVVRRTADDLVVGYYALAAGNVSLDEAPARMRRGAGHYNQPVIILTRLGVDVTVQGYGLGRALVVDALRRVAVTAEQVGVRAVLIHCESEAARDFYLRLAKFEQSPTDPLHLLLLIKDLRHAISGP